MGTVLIGKKNTVIPILTEVLIRHLCSWSDREKLFSFSAPHHNDEPTKVRMHLSLEITELSQELFKQQEVPMGRDEQQNTEQKQSIC